MFTTHTRFHYSLTNVIVSALLLPTGATTITTTPELLYNAVVAGGGGGTGRGGATATGNEKGEVTTQLPAPCCSRRSLTLWPNDSPRVEAQRPCVYVCVRVLCAVLRRGLHGDVLEEADPLNNNLISSMVCDTKACYLFFDGLIERFFHCPYQIASIAELSSKPPPPLLNRPSRTPRTLQSLGHVSPTPERPSHHRTTGMSLRVT